MKGLKELLVYQPSTWSHRIDILVWRLSRAQHSTARTLANCGGTLQVRPSLSDLVGLYRRRPRIGLWTGVWGQLRTCLSSRVVHGDQDCVVCRCVISYFKHVGISRARKPNRKICDTTCALRCHAIHLVYSSRPSQVADHYRLYVRTLFSGSMPTETCRKGVSRCTRCVLVLFCIPFGSDCGTLYISFLWYTIHVERCGDIGNGQ